MFSRNSLTNRSRGMLILVLCGCVIVSIDQVYLREASNNGQEKQQYVRNAHVVAANSSNTTDSSSFHTKNNITTKSPGGAITTAPLPSNPSTKAPNTTTNHNRNSTGGGLFYCGYNPTQVGRAVFPDYAARHEGGYNEESQKSFIKHPRREPTQDDILLFGMHGPCKGAKIQDFPGKVLVMNGEPHGGGITKRIILKGRKPLQDIYQIGSVPDSPFNHTLNAYYFTWAPFLRNYLVQGDKKLLRQLWDHSHKPINTGLHNALLYANSNCHPHREKAVNEISTIMPVHVAGKCQGAQPHKGTYVQSPTPRDGWNRNFQVQKDYKFCFAMENTYPYQPNYISEKMINPFLAGCIPIYYGTPQVFEVFNRKAMVYYDPKNPGPALKQIKELYHNETLYQEMLQQPILANGNATLKEHFSLLDEIEGGYLKQRIRKMMEID